MEYVYIIIQYGTVDRCFLSLDAARNYLMDMHPDYHLHGDMITDQGHGAVWVEFYHHWQNGDRMIEIQKHVAHREA